jgi:Fe-S cluster assembly protein SufD
VNTVRAQAIGLTERLGMPNRKMEHWKYTDVQALVNSLDLKPIDSHQGSSITHILPGTIRIDGNCIQGSLPDSWVKQGVKWIQIALHEDEQDFDDALTNLSEHTFIHWNSAFHSQRIVIHFPEQFSSNESLQLEYILPDSGLQTCNRVCFHLAQGAKANVGIRHTAPHENAKGWINEMIDCRLGNEAHLCILRRDTDLAFMTGIQSLLASLGKAARLDVNTLNTGAHFIRYHYEVYLEDEKSHAELTALNCLSEDNTVDHFVHIHHKAASCTSNQQFRYVASNRSTGLFSGTIQVHKDAQQTQAYQQCKGIVLTEGAKVYAKPRLIIYADDVKCSHGATVGQLDEEALFYLQSRGLSAASAKALLVEAFGEAFFNTIHDMHFISEGKSAVIRKMKQK